MGSSRACRPTQLPGQEGPWGDGPREVPRDGHRSSQEPCRPTQQRPQGDHRRVQPGLQQGRCPLSPAIPARCCPSAPRGPPALHPQLCIPEPPAFHRATAGATAAPSRVLWAPRAPPPLFPGGATAHPNSCSAGSQRGMDPQRPGPSWVTHTHSRTAGALQRASLLILARPAGPLRPPGPGDMPHTAESQAGSPWTVPHVPGAPGQAQAREGRRRVPWTKGTVLGILPHAPSCLHPVQAPVALEPAQGSDQGCLCLRTQSRPGRGPSSSPGQWPAWERRVGRDVPSLCSRPWGPGDPLSHPAGVLTLHANTFNNLWCSGGICRPAKAPEREPQVTPAWAACGGLRGLGICS